MKIFKRNKKQKSQPENLETIMNKFSKIINKWLVIRDESEDSFFYEKSEEDSFFPKYVMRMMREINEEMPNPSLDKIKSLEIISMGHVDYVRKFSLYCAELYMEQKKIT
jgi:hypothetical protein